jgi:aquaporin Z
MPIRVITDSGGFVQMKASFSRNWKHYLQEGLGLGIFMISACLFSSLLESNGSGFQRFIPDHLVRNFLIAVLMGCTALFIFYSPFTSPSGSQINPAVTLSFLWLGKMCHWDAFFYIISQFIGGTMAVYLMQYFLGGSLTNLPVNSAVTIPGSSGEVPALIIEFLIAFITMSTVLLTTNNPRLKKYTRIIAACLVSCWVIIAGPISGFGMNPARSFASALPANTWTAFWIYLIIPIAGMIAAAEFFTWLNYNKWIYQSASGQKHPQNNY